MPVHPRNRNKEKSKAGKIKGKIAKVKPTAKMTPKPKKRRA